MQSDQYLHDRRNHSDIWCLHKTDRLKHYGLHYAKYVGRLARDATEDKPVERTITDSTLVCLSAANTLHQDLSVLGGDAASDNRQYDYWGAYAEAAGRFADACEKIDHLEEFVPQALRANADILCWLLSEATARKIDLISAVITRRAELAKRHFYISDDADPRP